MPHKAKLPFLPVCHTYALHYHTAFYRAPACYPPPLPGRRGRKAHTRTHFFTVRLSGGFWKRNNTLGLHSIVHSGSLLHYGYTPPLLCRRVYVQDFIPHARYARNTLRATALHLLPTLPVFLYHSCRRAGTDKQDLLPPAWLAAVCSCPHRQDGRDITAAAYLSMQFPAYLLNRTRARAGYGTFRHDRACGAGPAGHLRAQPFCRAVRATLPL